MRAFESTCKKTMSSRSHRGRAKAGLPCSSTISVVDPQSLYAEMAPRLLATVTAIRAKLGLPQTIIRGSVQRRAVRQWSPLTQAVLLSRPVMRGFGLGASQPASRAGDAAPKWARKTDDDLG